MILSKDALYKKLFRTKVSENKIKSEFPLAFRKTYHFTPVFLTLIK